MDIDIVKAISENLGNWMKNHPKYNTVDTVSAASKIGFGTVRRIKNGQTNPTIKSLEAISSVFKRSVTELITPIATSEPLKAKEPEAVVYFTLEEHPAIAEVAKLMRTMDDVGKGMLLERAEIIAERRGITNKTNTA